MKANKMHPSQDIDNSLEPISKTKRKAAVEELQDIGVTLVALPKDKLAKLGLPESLMEAVLTAKRITANGATRRQMQYIGRLMREVDAAPIIDQLQRWQGKHGAETTHFHQLERWRDRLIGDENALSEFMQLYPSVDSQQIRALIRNSQREQAANTPPKNSRELYRLLREITEPGTA